MGAPRKYKLSRKRVDSAARSTLRRQIQHAQKSNDLRTWKRARAVLAFVEGGSIANIGSEVGVDPSTVSRWVAAYSRHGVPALSPAKAPGALPRLRDEQLEELGRIVEEGPESAGFDCGVWTGRLVGELIRQQFGVDYHWKYVPELLHKLGFSVQRPRKRLSRADSEAQEFWLRKTFPALKKRPNGKARPSSSRTKLASSSIPPCTRPGLE
jgi:transposase